jgi:hypothetical protein
MFCLHELQGYQRSSNVNSFLNEKGLGIHQSTFARVRGDIIQSCQFNVTVTPVNTAIHEPSAFPPDSITSLHEDSVFGVKGEPQSEIAKLRGGWAKHHKVGSVLSLGRLSSQDPRIHYDCLVLWLGRREHLWKVSLVLVSPAFYNEKTMFPDLDNIVVILDLPEATTPFAGKKMEVGAFAKVCAVFIS